MNDGLKDQQRNAIIEVLRKHTKIERAVLFGSRAMGTFTPTSDIDIALFGDLALRDQVRIADELEQLSIPYTVDLVRMTTVKSPELIAHIKKHGRPWLPVPKSMAQGKDGSGMTAEWATKSVDEVKAPQRGAIAIGPFGSRMKSENYVPAGVPVIRGTNIGDTRKFVGDMVYITDEFADDLGNAVVRAGDLVFPHRGSIGQVGIVPSDNNARYVLSTSLMKLTCDPAQVDPVYLFYFFRSQEGRHELLKNASTVGTPGIGQPLSSLRSIRFPCPPLPEQKAIARILGTLDDKIELNRRMNATLESMARALFKSWFVDFDPVHAKAAGRQPSGIAAATAALFPSAFQDSALGEIPEGWMSESVSNVFHLTMGQSPPGDTYNETGDGIPFYQGRTDFGFRFPTRRMFCTAPTRLAKAHDTLVSVRAPVGDINMAIEDCCIGRGIAAVRHKQAAQSFTYYAMANLHQHFANYESEGTVFGAINKSNFEKLPIVAPSNEVLAAFEKLVGPIDQQIRTNEQQSRTLATLRDTLLPKLLDGELSVLTTVSK